MSVTTSADWFAVLNGLLAIGILFVSVSASITSAVVLSVNPMEDGTARLQASICVKCLVQETKM